MSLAEPKGPAGPKDWLPLIQLSCFWLQLVPITKGVTICRSCASCSKISKSHRITPILKKKLTAESQLTCPKSQGTEETDLKPELESNPRQKPSCFIFWIGLLERLGQSKCPMAGIKVR